jgi:hypothetical protein
MIAAVRSGLASPLPVGSSIDGVMAPHADHFGDLYDDDTVAAIDAWRIGPGLEPVRGLRGRVAAAAVVAAGLTGVRDVFEEDTEPVIEELRIHDASVAREAVTLLFVPNDPSGTVAFVRPWLLRKPGPAILAAIGVRASRSA